MTDIDVAVRDKFSRTRAMIEYKFPNVTSIDLDSHQLRGHRLDADDRHTPIPVFAVVNYHLDANGNAIHAEDYPASTSTTKIESDELLALAKRRQYFVVAVNTHAVALLGGRQCAMLSEAEFWALHAAIVGEQLHDDDELQTTTVVVRTPEVRCGGTLVQAARYHRPPEPDRIGGAIISAAPENAKRGYSN